MDGSVKLVKFTYAERGWGEIGGLIYSITDALGKTLIRNGVRFCPRTPANAAKCLRMLADDLERKVAKLE